MRCRNCTIYQKCSVWMNNLSPNQYKNPPEPMKSFAWWTKVRCVSRDALGSFERLINMLWRIHKLEILRHVYSEYKFLVTFWHPATFTSVSLPIIRVMRVLYNSGKLKGKNAETKLRSNSALATFSGKWPKKDQFRIWNFEIQVRI